MTSPGFLFAASPEEVASMRSIEESRYRFASLPFAHIDAEARAQLYLLLGAADLEEAYVSEQLVLQTDDSHQSLFQLSATLIESLARTDEDDMERLAEHWAGSKAAEELNLEPAELLDFLFPLVNLCRTSDQEDRSIYLATMA